jgi:aldehyde dehydrogenase (NAD+)
MSSSVAAVSRSAIPGILSELRDAFAARRGQDAAWRFEQLRRFQTLIRENEDAILHALHQDLGRCNAESVVAETAYSLGDVDHALKNLSGWMAPERISTPMANQPGSSVVVREPLGVVLIVGPWNYPFQLLSGPLIGAIAAGNSVVLKPSEVSAATSALVARLVPAYLDASVVRVVEGGVDVATELLAERWDYIFYTGGAAVARVVMAAAAKHLTPVTLELGGKSPCVVDQDVDLDVACRRIAWAKFMNAGQTCVAPDYVLVHRQREGEFLGRMQAVLRDFYGEAPKDSQDFGRIINDGHFKRVRRFLTDNGRVVVGGDCDAASRYIAPTVLSEVPAHAPVMQEEIFGPVLPVVPVADMDQAIAMVNDRAKPLALYVFTRRRGVADRVLASTSSGNACVNDAMAQMGVPELPFGGVGESGFGGYHGRHSFETFSHRKGVLYKSTRVDPAIRYPPYTDSKLKWMRRLL